MLDVPHAIGVSSGTDALLVAMMALGIGPGDEVDHADLLVLRDGRLRRAPRRDARCSSTSTATRFNLDPAPPWRPITPRTQGDHPGAPVRPERRHGPDPRRPRASAGIPVIEDAAQAIGTRYKGRLVGGIGDARLLLVLPEQEPRRLRRRRASSRPTTTALAAPGAAAARPRDAAEVLPPGRRRQLPPRRAAGRGAARQGAAPRGVDRGAAAQRRALPRAVRRRGADGRWRCRSSAPDGYHIYNQFVVRVPDRDARARAPRRRAGIGTEIYYPVPFHLQECFAALGYRRGRRSRTPSAAARETLALPIYGELTEAQQRVGRRRPSPSTVRRAPERGTPREHRAR